MRLRLWLAVAVIGVAATVAAVAILVLDPFSGGSSGDGNAGESSLQKTLRKMVLQPGDVPEGFVSGDDAFITNDEAAADSVDPEERKGLLESWGRLLGYEVAYQPTSEAPDDLPVQGINVSASLYKTAAGRPDAPTMARMSARRRSTGDAEAITVALVATIPARVTRSDVRS